MTPPTLWGLNLNQVAHKYVVLIWGGGVQFAGLHRRPKGDRFLPEDSPLPCREHIAHTPPATIRTYVAGS